MKYILISDFTINEVPHGGSEWVNQVLMDNFEFEFEYSSKVTSFDPKNFYIISNISLMHPLLVSQIKNLNYVIMEHDYKICQSRHPWRYPDSIIPTNERINYDLYKNAKAVFVQTTDHMNVYLKNGVEANFVNLHSSIWSENDLDLLKNLLNNSKEKNETFAIYNTQNWIKNTQGNIDYCLKNGLEYTLISETKNRIDFLSNISKCKGLVFYPLARETFCRLVVESKCLGLEVTTSKNYGASLEPWFDEYSGNELIEFLRKNTDKNLNLIEQYL